LTEWLYTHFSSWSCWWM